MCAYAGSTEAVPTSADLTAAAARLAGACTADVPLLHHLTWDYLLCSWGGNFREERKGREGSETLPSILRPSQPIFVWSSPLMRSWGFFGGHVLAGIIPESVRHDSAFENCRGEL